MIERDHGPACCGDGGDGVEEVAEPIECQSRLVDSVEGGLGQLRCIRHVRDEIPQDLGNFASDRSQADDGCRDT